VVSVQDTRVSSNVKRIKNKPQPTSSAAVVVAGTDALAFVSAAVAVVKASVAVGVGVASEAAAAAVAAGTLPSELIRRVLGIPWKRFLGLDRVVWLDDPRSATSLRSLV